MPGRLAPNHLLLKTDNEQIAGIMRRLLIGYAKWHLPTDMGLGKVMHRASRAEALKKTGK